MNWLTDAPAHYRMADALDAGKRVIRKVGNDWLLFFRRTGEPVGCYDSHAEALRDAIAAATFEGA